MLQHATVPTVALLRTQLAHAPMVRYSPGKPPCISWLRPCGYETQIFMKVLSDVYSIIQHVCKLCKTTSPPLGHTFVYIWMGMWHMHTCTLKVCVAHA